MTDPVRTLSETSEQLLARLELLERLEGEKRRLAAGDSRLEDLEYQIATLASLVLEDSERQRDFGTVALLTGAGTGRSLDLLPPRELRAILGDWRNAERRAMAAPPDSIEARTARADVARLRDEYARAHASAAGSSGDWSRRP